MKGITKGGVVWCGWRLGSGLGVSGLLGVLCWGFWSATVICHARWRGRCRFGGLGVGCFASSEGSAGASGFFAHYLSKIMSISLPAGWG